MTTSLKDARTSSRPLRYCMSPEAGEITDMLLGDFLMSCMGKNDMAIVTAMMSSAVILVRTHCDRTHEDFDEVLDMARAVFDAAVKVMDERALATDRTIERGDRARE